jgi:hypothetical protein
MKSTKMAKSARQEVQNLEVRYGKIGISAVAAAMRYQGEANDPARGPTDRQPDRWLQETVPGIAA